MDLPIKLKLDVNVDDISNARRACVGTTVNVERYCPIAQCVVRTVHNVATRVDFDLDGNPYDVPLVLVDDDTVEVGFSTVSGRVAKVRYRLPPEAQRLVNDFDNERTGVRLAQPVSFEAQPWVSLEDREARIAAAGLDNGGAP